jgi:hypothetical protein
LFPGLIPEFVSGLIPEFVSLVWIDVGSKDQFDWSDWSSTAKGAQTSPGDQAGRYNLTRNTNTILYHYGSTSSKTATTVIILLLYLISKLQLLTKTKQSVWEWISDRNVCARLLIICE